MPKERSNRPLSPPKASPYSLKPDLTIQHRSTTEEVKEWEEARCPICIEHPHNAVLLKCSSHKKGCRPYICDTSYRHSNCLDQFKKLFEASKGLECPFCRGPVSNLVAVGPARQLMDSRVRACSCEGCDFAGTYQELRAHARALHPLARPSLADPGRKRDWARMEEWVIGDLISIQNAGDHDFDLSDDDVSDLIPQRVVLESYYDARSDRMTETRSDDVSSNLRPRRVPESHRDTRRVIDDVSNLRPRRTVPEIYYGTRSGRTMRASSDYVSNPRPRRIVPESSYYHTRGDDVSDDPRPRRARESHRDTRRGGDDVSAPGHRRVVPESYHGTRSERTTGTRNDDVSSNIRSRRVLESHRDTRIVDDINNLRHGRVVAERSRARNYTRSRESYNGTRDYSIE